MPLFNVTNVSMSRDSMIMFRISRMVGMAVDAKTTGSAAAAAAGPADATTRGVIATGVSSSEWYASS